jgi:hypothetical protein
MSDTPSKRPPIDWLDAKLGDWPGVQRTDAAWEAMASDVERRLAAGERGTSLASIDDEKIFSDPFGQTPEESHNTAASSAALKSTTSAAPASSRSRGKSEESMSMSSDRERDRRSLQDLAKLAANTTPAPSSVRFDVGPLSSPSSARAEEDSGLVDLKAFAAAPASSAAPAPASSAAPAAPSSKAIAAAPASVAPASVAPASVAAGPVSAPASSAPASSIGAAVISSAPLSAEAPLSAPSVSEAAAAAPAAAVVAAPAEKKNGNGKIIAIGGLFAAAAIAAGAFFAMKSKPVEEPTAMNTPKVEAPKVETKPATPTETQAAPTEDKGADPNALPAANTPSKTAPVAVKGGAAPAAAAKAEKPEPKDDKKVTAADLPASGGAAGAGDLGAAMRQAAGPAGGGSESKEPTGPQFAAGSVPQKPSQGAVTGALGAVLGGARACVGADDPISRATVTFASAGNVTNVSVSGGAVGKPAEACIKAALSKAHVAPFAEATYSAPVTIRH